MARNLRLDSDEALPPSTESADNPHFFKIIHSTVLGDGKLIIPKRFARIYGKILSDIMFLKIPSGAVWKVGLMRGEGDDEVWFQTGWQKFAEYYTIGYGHLIVFRYDGDSTFHVLIFDMTATEIEYPSTTNDQHHQQPNTNIVVRTPIKTKNLTILDVFPARCTMKDKDRVNVTSSGEGDGPCFPNTVDIESDVSVEMFDVLPTRENHGRVMGNGNPFFKVKMEPSYTRGRLPFIPMRFVKTHLKTDYKCITVYGRDRRTWSMKYRVKRGRYGNASAEFSSDWRIFERDNQLKLGDVCLFELIKSPFILLKVVIFRNDQDLADQ